MIKADINFPDYLPLPLLHDGNRQKGQTFVRTDEKLGIAKQRKGFAFQTTIMNCSFVLSKEDAFLFENFFYSKSGLNNGAKWFNMKRKTVDGIKILACRFTQPFESSPYNDSGYFSYKAQIEVIND